MMPSGHKFNRIVCGGGMLVVGNAFQEYTNGETCLTVEDLVSSPKVRLWQTTRLVIGQGVGRSELEKIYAFLRDVDALDDTQVVEQVSRKANPGLVHKRFSENVLVTVPHKSGRTSFEIDLVIDDACAELSDHITGVHLQGMVLIEAARQAYMVCAPDVMAEYEIPSGERRFMLREIRVQYHKYLYPLPTRILVQVSDVKYLRRTNIAVAQAVMEFVQLGDVGVTISCKALSGSSKTTLEQEKLDGARALAAITAPNPKHTPLAV